MNARRQTRCAAPEVSATSRTHRAGAQDPLISKQDIAHFRNGVKQNVCVQLLQEGAHRSFCELFSLLRSDEGRRAAAELGSSSVQVPLDQQGDKLETMRLHLSRAEQAEREGQWSVVCEERLTLGHYFSDDLWLSLHFYQSCACRGRTRAATEARVCMAELYLQQGDLAQAQQQGEVCVAQVEGGGWSDPAGAALRLRARAGLWRTYEQLAAAAVEGWSFRQALDLLQRGHALTTRSENKLLEGDSAYRLGLTYQLTGDHHTAKKFLSSSMQIYGTMQDADGLGRAYQAMAKSLQSEGNTHETVKCLETLIDITRSSGLQRHLVDACLCLGNIYYNMCEFQRACEFFRQSYEEACDIRDVDLLQRAQTLLGCARAQSLTRKLMDPTGSEEREEEDAQCL